MTSKYQPVRLGLVAAAFAALGLLTACQTMPGSSAQAAEAAKSSPVPVADYDSAGRGIIAYYGAPNTDAEGERRPTAQEGGFYRAFLGRNEAGQYLVQDFYQATGTPLTGVFPVASASDIQGWDTLPEDGEVVFYRPNGDVRSITHYQNGQLHGKDVYFNADGTERSVFHWAEDMLDGPFVAREPGTLRSVEGVAQRDEIVSLTGTGLQGETLSEEEALHLLNESLVMWYEDIFE